MSSRSRKPSLRFAPLRRCAVLLLASTLPAHLLAQPQVVLASSAAALSLPGVEIRLPRYWFGGPSAAWISPVTCAARSSRPFGERIITNRDTLRTSPLADPIGEIELEEALQAAIPRSALRAIASSTAPSEACSSVRLVVLHDLSAHQPAATEEWTASAMHRLRTRGLDVTRTRVRRGPWAGEQLQYVLDRGDDIQVTTAEIWSRPLRSGPLTLVFTWSTGQTGSYHETERAWILDHAIWPGDEPPKPGDGAAIVDGRPVPWR